MPCTVVVGAQWGDEGKGKIVDALSEAADVVARYQGGPNAGHSVIHRGETLVLHLVPSGILHAGRRCLIGNGVVIDPLRLREEVTTLESKGVPASRQLGVSAAAHLILPYHRAVEASSERGPGAIGTTGRGIGYAYRDKAARTGLRVGDLFDREHFVAQADRNLTRLKLEFPEVAAELAAMSGAGLHDQLRDVAAWLQPLVVDVGEELHTALVAGKRVLLEGAQGTLLDLDHGTYPYVTSSPASAAGAPLGVGLGPRAVDHVIGVTKAYATRVGHGPFPSEMPPAEAALLREAGGEYGATTGRPRRCGWLDIPALARSLQLNGVNGLCITKLDVLDGMREVRICTGYMVRGKPLALLPSGADAVAECEPVYESMPGWSESTVGAQTFDALPANARAYLRRIEKLTGAPIAMVSTGPDRDETILLQHPFH